MALTVAKYLVQPIFSQGDELPDEAIRLLAAVFITFLTWLNCYSMKITTRLQNTFMVTKILALALLIVIGFVAMFQGKQTAENKKKNNLGHCVFKNVNPFFEKLQRNDYVIKPLPRMYHCQTKTTN